MGTYLVQRRLALMGDGIGHVCVTGVALGLLTGTSPTWTAVVVAILGAILIEVIRERGHTNGDVALALLFYGGIAGGVLLTGLGGQSAARLQEYLFGSITTISVSDVLVTMALAAVVIVCCVGLLPQLFAVAHDEEFARVAGLNVRAYNLLIAVLAAVSVSVAMRTVGLLLVWALMVVPVATSQQLTRSFRTTLGPRWCSARSPRSADWSSRPSSPSTRPWLPDPRSCCSRWPASCAPGPLGIWLRHRARLRTPFLAVDPPAHETTDEHGDDHGHEHGPGCGHPAVEHGDHVDYIHDGHRHAVHGGHYDEH